MIYKNTIQAVLDYIDANIKDSLTIENLAEAAAFSTPHFFRMFLFEMDITPMKYVLRRKLYFAAKALVGTNTKIVDIAFEYGFESHDVFSRAFRRYYGVSPHLFRKNGSRLGEFYRENSYCISDYAIPLSLNNEEKDESIMSVRNEHEVKIVTLPETKLIGIERKIGGDEWAFDAFYNAYDRIFRNAPNRKYPNSPNATHALSELMSGSGTNPESYWNYFIGIEVTSLDDVPEGAVSRVLPSQLCAVVGYEGGLDYKEVTEYLYGVWLERNTYKIDHRFAGTWEYYSPNKDCEVYEERIYMPIMPMEYEIMEIPSYSGVYVLGVGESGGEAKKQAFDKMLIWASEQKLFEKGEVKFEVYYGQAENENVFCEIFHRTDCELPMCDGMKRKSYRECRYFKSSNMHHNLEQTSRAIWRYIKQDSGLCFSNSGEPDYRPYFEEYRLSGAELDLYTPIDIYVCIKER